MEKLSKHATSNLITDVENKKITDLIDNQNGIVSIYKYFNII